MIIEMGASVFDDRSQFTDFEFPCPNGLTLSVTTSGKKYFGTYKIRSVVVFDASGNTVRVINPAHPENGSSSLHEYMDGNDLLAFANHVASL